MQILVAGVSYRTAPVERLERLAVGLDTLPTLLLQATHHLGEGVILSTCNRTEVYTVAEDPEAGERRLVDFLDLLDRRHDAPVDPLGPSVYIFSGDEAVRHLFRVASGLDSLVLGEPEIVNQVATALRAAGEAGAVSHRLSRLFHYALRTSRKVRRETGVARHSVSISAIGVRLLERAIGDLAASDVLLVGVGETGRLAARALKHAGVRNLTVTSRRPGRATEAAAELGAAAISMSEMGGALTAADAVVTCTSAQEAVVTADAVRLAMERRPGRPLFILDLALPADVEPQVATIPAVTVFGLSALTEMAEEHRAGRQSAAEEAETLVDREVAHFNEILIALDAEPVIKALGERAETIRKREVERALKGLPGLAREEVEVVEAMSRAIVKRLLADPISFLRAGGDWESAAAVARAFDLDGESDFPIDDRPG